MRIRPFNPAPLLLSVLARRLPQQPTMSSHPLHQLHLFVLPLSEFTWIDDQKGRETSSRTDTYIYLAMYVPCFYVPSLTIQPFEYALLPPNLLLCNCPGRLCIWRSCRHSSLSSRDINGQDHAGGWPGANECCVIAYQ